MSDAGTNDVAERQQAKVPWGDLLPDVLLLFTGALAMVLSFIVDACCACHYAYFPRSGAIAALIAGVIAFRSLNKHYKKFLKYSDLSKVPYTSRNQRTVDKLTLLLSIVGTLVWAYGDIIFANVRG